MKRVFATLAAWCVVLANPAWPAEHILARQPVLIVTTGDPAMFPKGWRGSPVEASATPIPPERYERATAILTRALHKYPKNMLAKHLRKVYVVSNLRFSGIWATGTYADDVIYIQVGDEQKGPTANHIELDFHAEFSSILLQKYRREFNKEGWNAINPPGFHYGKGGVDAALHNKISEPDGPERYRRGFWHQYSESDIEEDFNAFAALLFAGGPDRWQNAIEYPRLHAKLQLTLNFYAKIDPAFTPAFFRHLNDVPEPARASTGRRLPIAPHP